MKKFLSIIILIFFCNNSLLADKIEEFQIDNISIGDSILEFLDEEKIEKDTIYFYGDNKYGTISIYNSKEYDRIQFTYDSSDRNYKVHGIAAVIIFDNDINACKTKMKKVIEDVEPLIGNKVNKETGSSKRSHDPSGKSIMYFNEFIFSDESVISINCTNWSEEITKKKGWTDELKISFYSNKFANYLSK